MGEHGVEHQHDLLHDVADIHRLGNAHVLAARASSLVREAPFEPPRARLPQTLTGGHVDARQDH
jgi:hypothetical protein